MKIKIKYDALWHRYYWVLTYSNGRFLAESRYYVHRSSAKRSLDRFCENLSTVCLHDMVIV